MMTHFLIALAMISLAPPDVRVTQLDGQVVEGQLTALTRQHVALASSAEQQQIPIEAVMAIELQLSAPAAGTSSDPAAAVSSGAGQHVLLHDGSTLRAESVVRTAQEFVVGSALLGTQTLPAQAVRALRLAAEDPAVSSQWQTFLQREGNRDLLIVPKRDGSGLDFLAGIVAAVDAEKVTFLLDGDTIPVPLARVYGVVFSKPEKSPLQGSSVVHLTNGDRLSARSVLFADNSFELVTSWDQPLRLEATGVRGIDFSSGRIQYLSDLQPLQERFDGIDPEGSLFAGLIDAETARLMYGPRRDTTLDPPQKIRLRNRRFEKGLCIHSRTELTYALDRQYETFEAIVGVDDEVAFNQSSQVSLTVSVDGKVIFDRVFQTDEDPVPVRLPVMGASTLKILVDYADGDSSCDWLDLADAKLIRKPEAN